MIATASRLLAAVILAGAMVVPMTATAAPSATDPASSLSRAFPLGGQPLCCRAKGPRTTTTAAHVTGRVAVRDRTSDRPGTLIALIAVGLPVGAGIVVAAAVSRRRAAARTQPTASAARSASGPGATVAPLRADRCGQLVEVAQRPLRGQSGERLIWAIVAVDLHTGTAWTGLAQATRGAPPSPVYLSEIVREMTLDLYMAGHTLEAIVVEDPGALTAHLGWRLGARGLTVLPLERLAPSRRRAGRLLDALGSALADQRISATAPGTVEERLARWTQERNATLAESIAVRAGTPP